MLIVGRYYNKCIVMMKNIKGIVRNHVNLNIGKLYKNMRVFGNNMSGAAARTGNIRKYKNNKKYIKNLRVD